MWQTSAVVREIDGNAVLSHDAKFAGRNSCGRNSIALASATSGHDCLSVTAATAEQAGADQHVEQRHD